MLVKIRRCVKSEDFIMNKEISSEELQTYLKQAIELETDIAIQEKIQSDYLKISEEKRPQLSLAELPPKPICEPNPAPDGVKYIFWGIVIFMLGSWLVSLANRLNGSVGAILLLAVLITSIVFIIRGFVFIIKNLNHKLAYRKQMKKYHAKCASYEAYSQAVSEQYVSDMKIWERSNDEIVNMTSKPLKETKELLEEYYSAGIVYPKYRNLPALASMYEYLITGRCESLTGPHGAYNLYEDEIRKDMVISQLSVVIQNLERIKQNQYMLYQQVKEIQQTVNSIGNELRNELQKMEGYSIQIASLTALNAYYSALNERNTRITMWCNI